MLPEGFFIYTTYKLHSTTYELDDCIQIAYKFSMVYKRSTLKDPELIGTTVITWKQGLVAIDFHPL